MGNNPQKQSHQQPQQQTQQVPEAVVFSANPDPQQAHEQVQAPVRNGAGSRPFRQPEQQQEQTLEEAMHEMQGNLAKMNDHVIQIVKTANSTVEAVKALQAKTDELQLSSLDLRKKENKEFIAELADMTGQGELAHNMREKKEDYVKESFSLAGIKRLTKRPVLIGDVVIGVAVGGVIIYGAQQAGWIDLSVLYPSMDTKKK